MLASLACKFVGPCGDPVPIHCRTHPRKHHGGTYPPCLQTLIPAQVVPRQRREVHTGHLQDWTAVVPGLGSPVGRAVLRVVGRQGVPRASVDGQVLRRQAGQVASRSLWYVHASVQTALVEQHVWLQLWGGPCPGGGGGEEEGLLWTPRACKRRTSPPVQCRDRVCAVLCCAVLCCAGVVLCAVLVLCVVTVGWGGVILGGGLAPSTRAGNQGQLGRGRVHVQAPDPATARVLRLTEAPGQCTL